MKKLICILAGVLLTMGARAQTPVIITNVPRTSFEQANATPDAVLVHGMSIIATLNNQINYPVEIRAERLANQMSSNNVYGVSIRTKLTQNWQVDYIDYDELDNLIRGVTMISQANNSVTPLDNYEVAIRTRCGLSLAKLGRGNKTIIVMTTGGTNNVRNEMASFVLDDIGRYLTAAKAKLDAVAATGQ